MDVCPGWEWEPAPGISILTTNPSRGGQSWMFLTHRPRSASPRGLGEFTGPAPAAGSALMGTLRPKSQLRLSQVLKLEWRLLSVELRESWGRG